MATIQTAIQLYDGVSAPLKAMDHALGTIIGSFQEMQTVLDQSVNISKFHQTQESVFEIQVGIHQWADEISNATIQQDNFNNTIMYSTVAILVILVQLIQFIGNKIYNKLK